MTEPQDLDRYIDDFGTRLSDAAPAGSRRRAPRRRVVLAAAGAVLAAGLLAAGLGTSGDRLDPVAEARAALDPAGEIIYMRITSTPFAERANSVPPAQTTEQWSALDPPRYRFVQTVPRRRGSQGGQYDAHGPVSGRIEISYADGAQRTYIADRDTLSVVRGYSDQGSAARAPSLLGTGSGNLQTDLGSMLADGDVSDQGERRIGGRTVRRLVIEHRSPRAGAAAKSKQPGGRSEVVRRLVYDVDPDTFEPLQGTFTITLPGRPQAIRIGTRMHVDAYKRIPLTATTAALLRIQTTPRTKVSVKTAKELREQLGARTSCRRLKNGDVACKTVKSPKVKTP